MPYANQDERKAYIKRHYELNREKYLERSRQWRRNQEYMLRMVPVKRRSMLKSRYGITTQDYFDMLKKQNYVCAICETNNPNNGHGNLYFDIDHCHETGKVRGLLCRDCNLTVGMLEKKKAKLFLIETYLALHAEHDPKS